MDQRRPFVAGNWKMHGVRADLAPFKGAFAGLEPVELALCLPATLIAPAADLDLSPIALGGQDCRPEGPGARTGDICPAMLKDAGADWVILGHSERRAFYGESDALIAEKAAAAAAAGLKAIVCVGETGEDRAAGQAEAVVARQLRESLPEAPPPVIAYEPVWAIGSGQTPSAAEIEAMHAFLRAALAQRWGAAGRGVRILYGGSVKPDNARAILSLSDVDGALVGGASLRVEDFRAIAEAARA